MHTTFEILRPLVKMPTPHILPNPRTGHAYRNARADALVVGRGVEAAAVPERHHHHHQLGAFLRVLRLRRSAQDTHFLMKVLQRPTRPAAILCVVLAKPCLPFSTHHQ